MRHPYLELIEKQIPVLFDGAVGTEIQKASVAKECYQNAAGCNEILNVTCPDVLIAIHNSYLLAGADVIQTNTFGGSKPKLKEYGLENRVFEINKAAAQNARKAIVNSGISDKPLFVCGSMGPTGYLPSANHTDLSGVNFDELVQIYAEQSAALISGGIDIIRIETSQDLLEVRAAVVGVKRTFKQMKVQIPIQVQITVDTNGLMLLGSGIESFLGAVVGLGVDIIGINCGTGPAEMSPAIRKLLSLSPIPVAALPNAGMPHNIDGKAVYTLTPKEFAEQILPLITNDGLSVVGGCCGTSPEHIRALSDKLKNCNVAIRKISQKSCWLSTGIGGVNLETMKRPVIIGERLNAQGSKKTKELVLANNYDELFQIANEQIIHGSTLLDICVAVNERDTEPENMKNLVRYLSDRSKISFCIDSTEPAVIEEALKVNPGSMMINSINLEQGASRARKILELAVKFGCPLIALPIDDEGMARTIDKKIELTRKLRELACVEFGLPENYLYIDPLVFTLATGEASSADAAMVSLDAIRKIKHEFPGIRTAMGVSNVSFGLQPKARRVLNNLMLYHAVKAGLDAAIFNPLHLDNVEQYDKQLIELGDNLLFNKNADALSLFVQHFETTADKKVKVSGVQLANVSDEEKLKLAILNRDRRDLGSIITLLLNKLSASDILNEILLPAMAEVGEKMSKGEMILPFVLQAAEVMKEAVTILEPHLKGAQSAIKGTIVLATVYGDVHDIGKNLVGSILRNQGYKVIDLGKQVPIDTIVETVKREKPDAVGLSALLVTTSRQMALCVEEFYKQGILIPVIIGGAAVNKEFAARIVNVNSTKYEGGVFYARDAFEASRLLENIDKIPPAKKTDIKEKPKSTGDKPTDIVPSALEYGPIIEPPFWGTSDILIWNTENLLKSINKERLFKAEWGGGKLDPAMYTLAVEKDFTPAFDELENEINLQELIDARGMYGFFPVITDKENLIILEPDNFASELFSFKFPRMPHTHNRSLADYFRPEGDIIAVQVVTIGPALGNRCRQYFQKENKYSRGFLLNGIGNYIVESLADRVTIEIRRALGIDTTAGRRYSFGFPGLPSLEDQKGLFEILGVEERLGVELTPGFQMDPEHSTIGIFVHHTQAEYLK